MAKRTIENCSMVKQALKEGIGHCGTEDGKCLGYAQEGGEPHDTCKECKLHLYHEDENKVYYFEDGYRDYGLFVAAKSFKDAKKIALSSDYDILAYVTYVDIKGEMIRHDDKTPIYTDKCGELSRKDLDELEIDYIWNDAL